ncbi:MAG: FmdE family protein, partial [Candidatus Altiarchaeota archaeon]|nr:FmdE family protein [Candidatus Altiarchaeota archaeon]
MKRFNTVVLAIVLGSIFAVTGSAQESLVVEYPALEPLVDFVGGEDLSVLHLAGFKASEAAMNKLGFEKNSRSILALTDAGYIAEVSGYTTEKALDGVTLSTGNSRGKGNLVNVHKPYNAKLWFAFFDRESGDCVYLEADSEVLKTYLDRERTDRSALRDFMKLDGEKIFTRIAKENIGADKLLSNPEPWQE